MRVDSISGYFYRMFNINYLLVLLPLAGFIYTYIQYRREQISALLGEEDTFLLQVVLSGLVAFDMAVVQVFTAFRLRRIRREPSLGRRLEAYFTVNLIRFATGSFSSILLAGGFYVTLSQYFSAALLVVLAWMAWHWPLARKVCDDLRLRGDELRVVLHRQDLKP
jgi:hypothetical protein